MTRRMAIIWQSSFLLLFVLLVTAISAQAKVILDTSGKGEMVALQGDVSREDVNEMRAILESGKLKISFLLLESSAGGDAYAAMDLGRIVRKNNFTVWVWDKCLSACALVYIAGVERKSFGVIGPHRPYFVGTPMPTAQVGAATTKMLAEIKKYVAEMNVTEEFYNIMVNTYPSNLRTYVKGDIETIVPESDPLYDEINTAFWARVHGVSTEEFRRRNADARIHCNDTGPSDVAGITAGEMCVYATRWGMTVSAFEPRFKLALQKCGTVDDAALPNRVASNWDNSALIQNENCIRRSMLTPQKTVRFVIQPQFAGALSFHEGLARVSDGYWHSGFIDKLGRIVIAPTFLYANSFQEGLAAVQVGDGKKDQYGAPTGKWGFIDKQGHMVISPQYANADSFQAGLAAVQVDDGKKDTSGFPTGKWGFIDKSGKILIQPQFAWAESFHEGLAAVNVGARHFGFVDKDAQFVVQPRFDPVGSFQEGLAAAGTTSGTGFIDKEGRFVINPNPNILGTESFHEGLSLVHYSPKANGGGTLNYGFIDKQGRIAIKQNFFIADSFQQGLAAACVDINACGFIDREGDFVISPQFEAADSFSEGLAAVMVHGKWGYIAW